MRRLAKAPATLYKNYMAAMKVLISDKIEEVCPRRLREFSGIEVLETGGLKPEQLLAEVVDCAGLIVRSASKVTREVIEAGSGLKVIGRAGAGVDNIDVKAATSKGIVVMNTPGGNSNAVAELTIGLMLALAREVPRGDATMKAGKWEKKSFLGGELAGKTLGLIGVGFVGSKVAVKARGLDMKVLVHDPFVSQDEARRLGVDMVDLDALLKASDYVSLHLPRNPQTAGMINAAALARMKRGVYLVNCARGGIIVESDLLVALESGQVAGAAVDVYDPEPPVDFSLARHPKVVAMPHIGASTLEAQNIVARMIAEQVGAYLTTGKVKFAVNA
jgi:D-3-phosphoglycerate dehydrogenase